VSQQLARSLAGLKPVTSVDGKLGLVMKYIRAVERGVAGELDVCRQLYPGIDAYVSNPYLVTGNLTRHLTSLKQHALELARDHALAQMEEATALAAEGQEDLARRRRAKGARLLYKLAPGSCAKIGAIQTPDGSVVQEPGHMARVLRDHWSQVFTTRGVDVDLLGRWVEEDAVARTEDGTTQEAMKFVQVRRKHVAIAVKRSNNSSPGPDGIPYSAWRLLGDDAIDILYEALQAMSLEDGPFWMRRRYKDFNASLLLFLPKKPIDVVDGAEVYAVDGARPLNVTNTDNRLVASAVRVAIEPVLNSLITWDQRGFLTGRSMLSNILDVEEALAHAAILNRDAVAVFYDFAAAFPSIEHALMFTYFSALGWPSWLMRIISILYYGNRCDISMGNAIVCWFWH